MPTAQAPQDRNQGSLLATKTAIPCCELSILAGTNRLAMVTRSARLTLLSSHGTSVLQKQTQFEGEACRRPPTGAPATRYPPIACRCLQGSQQVAGSPRWVLPGRSNDRATYRLSNYRIESGLPLCRL